MRSLRSVQIGTLLAAGILVAAQIASADDAPPAIYQPTPADMAELQKIVATAQSGDLATAGSKLSELHDAHPNWIDVLLLRGQLFTLKKLPDTARESYQDAVNLDPKNRTALMAIAAISLQTGDPAAALKAVDAQLANTPGDGEAAIVRAQALVGTGNKAIAAKYLLSFLKVVTPAQRPSVLPLVIPIQLSAEDFTTAESEAAELIAATPTPDAYAWRADARRGQQKFDDAMADIAAGITLNQGRPTFPLLFTGCRVTQDRGKIAQAITQLADLLELAPGNAEVENAIAAAVVARQAQMKASKNNDDTALIPPIPYAAQQAHPEAIEQYKLAAAIGKERIAPLVAKIKPQLEQCKVIDYESCDAILAVYPAPDIYAERAQTYLALSLDPPAQWPPDNTARANKAIRDFRIAAALLATHLARGIDSNTSSSSRIDGYFDWAQLQQDLLAGQSSEPDKRLITAYVTLDESDGWAAAVAYATPRYQYKGLIDSGHLSGPNDTLLNRLRQNPIRLRSILQTARSHLTDALVNKDFKAAMDIADQMVRILPNAPDGYIARAHVFHDQGDKEKTAAALTEALRQDFSCAEAHLMQGGALEIAGKSDEALLEYNLAAGGLQSLPQDDANPAWHAIQDRDLLERGRDPVALRKVYADACNAAYNNHDHEQAAATAVRLMYGFEPATAGVYAIAGISQAHYRNQFADAAHNLARAMELDPKLDLQRDLAKAQENAGDHQAARATYTTLLAASPDNAVLYAARAAVEQAIPDQPAAVSDYQTAIAKGDTSDVTKAALAQCLVATDSAAAAALLKQVIASPVNETGLFADGELEFKRTAKARLFLIEQAQAQQPH